ncbi:hypothetical protein GCM10010306_075810 [Streptomyces umbrinus]|nr:hypothetical protein GCM10010306_075810 [Streptomyces umbrinus]
MEDGAREAVADEAYAEGALADGAFAEGGASACTSHAFHLSNAVAKVQARGTMGLWTYAIQAHVVQAYAVQAYAVHAYAVHAYAVQGGTEWLGSGLVPERPGWAAG